MDKETRDRLLELNAVDMAKRNNKKRKTIYKKYLKIKKLLMPFIKIIIWIIIIYFSCRVILWISIEIVKMITKNSFL